MDTTTDTLKGTEINVLHDTRLISSEIASLWVTYMDYSLVKCVFKHFLSNVEDANIRSIIEYDLSLAEKRTAWVKNVFEQEDIPIPNGYTDEDIDLKAPRLYSDLFYLYYILNKTRIALNISNLAMTSSTRPDIREFYSRCCDSTTDVFQKTTDLMLTKGIYIRPPYITIQKTVDNVKRQTFLRGFLGERRPLLAQEISGLFLGSRINSFGIDTVVGFRQVAKSKQVRDYLDRGIKLAKKLFERYVSFLENENIPVPTSSDTFVTDSTVSPFSDKLIMAQIMYMNTAGMVAKGTILSTILRHDITAALAVSVTEIANYAEDGVNIMIENGWLEEPPRLVDREELKNLVH